MRTAISNLDLRRAASLDEALAILRDEPRTPIAGATDVYVALNFGTLGATLDARFRAFDLDTGRELWSAPLPAGAKATPMTYAARGKQYVAIAAGGDNDVFGRSDEIVVFALPGR